MRPPVTGYGRAGGVLFVVEELAALRTAWLDLSQPDDQATRWRLSNGTKLLKNVGNAFAGRSVAGRAALPSTISPDQLVADDPR